MILTAVAYYLLFSIIGALIFIGIGSHVCTKDNEYRDFLADATAAYKRGEL